MGYRVECQFSDIQILAEQLKIDESKIAKVISKCGGSPEAINNHPLTAPSKRLDEWSSYGMFRKVTMGIQIAKKIGIEKMREKCPLFNEWLAVFEKIQKNKS